VAQAEGGDIEVSGLPITSKEVCETCNTTLETVQVRFGSFSWICSDVKKSIPVASWIGEPITGNQMHSRLKSGVVRGYTAGTLIHASCLFARVQAGAPHGDLNQLFHVDVGLKAPETRDLRKYA
jgi:hypothetical protein